MKEKILEDLKSRGLIKDITNENKVLNLLENGSSIYCGFDPTAESLHVGHLLPLLTLLRLKEAGVPIKPLIGGATGMIGDPSFKHAERTLNSLENIDFFKSGIKEQLSRILGENIKVVDNFEWTKSLTLLDFLRETGKLFSVNTMIKKDSVKSRIEREDSGISFTEFTYQIMQAMDFHHLFKHENCSLQMGGSDQWGNIIAGIDLINKKESNVEVGAFTLPLLLKSNGEKFGKSVGGAVWLDPNKTTPFEFFQFWLNITDEEVVSFFKMLSFRELNEIDEILKEDPSQRLAQKLLAEELTMIVHGQKELENVRSIQKILFSKYTESINEIDFNNLLRSKNIDIYKAEKNIGIVEILISSGRAKSKRIARELINQKSVKLNGELFAFNEANSLDQTLEQYWKFEKFILIQKGKKDFVLIVRKTN